MEVIDTSALRVAIATGPLILIEVCWYSLVHNTPCTSSIFMSAIFIWSSHCTEKGGSGKMATNQVRASDLQIFTANPLTADPMVTAALLCCFFIPFSFLTVCVTTPCHSFVLPWCSISSDTMMWQWNMCQRQNGCILCITSQVKWHVSIVCMSRLVRCPPLAVCHMQGITASVSGHLYRTLVKYSKYNVLWQSVLMLTFLWTYPVYFLYTVYMPNVPQLT